METRNEEKGQIASTYTDTVAKLVEVSLVLQQVDTINDPATIILINPRLIFISKYFRLLQTMSEIERVSTEQMYKEQSWVEALLKRMRNEADTQTQSFHTYLVEQLLSVASSILAAVSNQQNTVNSLSNKIDQTVSSVVINIFISNIIYIYIIIWPT